MRAYDLLEKKKRGEVLSQEELHFLIDGYVQGEIPDYQMAAFLMAVCLRGMTDQETEAMTQIMRASGAQVDLAGIEGPTVDKHSTGGVGDKTTLVLAPAIAALGGRMMKMSGRGLGYTGGTIDKLESIPGFRTALSTEEAVAQVNRIGVCILGQSEDLAPADKKIYALRDLTATVDSVPLIAASIMSKKLAVGNQGIVLDVTYGSGAFMKTPEAAVQLAQKMIHIGRGAGRKMAAVISSMEIPLGHYVGNLCEIREAIDTLCGRGPEDLTEVCVELGGAMWALCCDKDRETCMQEFLGVLQNGQAFEMFQQMVRAQGGDLDAALAQKAGYTREIRAWKSGYVTHMDTEKIGIAVMTLGAGRKRKEDSIDPLAGLFVAHKTGEDIEGGDLLFRMEASSRERFASAEEILCSAVTMGNDPVSTPPLLYKILH